MESATKIHEGASTTPELDTEQVPLTVNSLKAKSRGSKIYKASTSISSKKNQLSNQEPSIKNLGLTPAVLLPQGYNTIKELQHVYREKKKVKTDFFLLGDITALTITPDSEYIIAGSQDGTINIFRTITNQLFKSIGRVHDGKINALTFGPLTDCTTSLITASDDRSIKIFDWQHELDSFHLQDAHEGRVTCVVYNHAKQCIISASSDNFINIFALTTNPLYANLSHRIPCDYNGPITSLALKQDGTIIFSSGDTSIKVHNLDTYKEIYHFKDAHNGIISSIILSPDKFSLISASHDMSIKVWDTHEYKSSPVLHLENVHTEKIKSIDISSDSNFILSTGEKGSIKVLSIKEKLQVHQIPKNPQNKLAMFNKTGETSSIIVGSIGRIDILNFETMQAPFFRKDLPIEIRDDFESENTLSANHQYILSYSSQQRSTKLFDSNTLQLLDDMSYHFQIPYDSKVLVSSNGKYVITIDSDNRLSRFDRVKEIVSSVNISDAVNSAIISPDSQMIICACDNSIQTFNIETLANSSSIEYKHSVPLELMAMSSDLKYLIASRVDRSILLFSLTEKRELYHFKNVHQRKINGIAINKNLIASCSQDKSIKLFDIETCQLVHHFINADSREVTSVGFSLDNRFLFTGSENLRVFDLETKMPLPSFNRVTGSSILPSFSNLASMTVFVSSQINAIGTLPNGNILCLHKHGPPDVYQFKEAFQKISSHTFNNLETSQATSSNEQEISYFYFKSHYSLFNSLEDSILNNLQKEKAYVKALESEFCIFPHSWNLLHIACIEENHAFIKNMPAYKDFKLQFILDHHLKTPFHYLLAHQEIDYSSVNTVLAYICDYLEARSSNKYEYIQIVKSLTPLLWFILQKSPAKIKERFLELCEINSPVPYNLELPTCGSPLTSSAQFLSTPEISQNLTEKICRKGQEEVHFKTNLLYLDYNVASEDMNMTTTILTKAQDDSILQTNAITRLVDHLWKQSQLFLAMNLALFSVFIVGLSVYIGLQRSHVPFEAALLTYSGLLLCGELLKFSSLRPQYLLSPWRLIGFLHLILTIIFLAVRLAQKDKNNLALSWVSAIIILVGYLIWITHLRLIKPIRKLFSIVTRIARDMLSFVAIVAFIIVAFAIVFLIFEIGGWDHYYGFYLFNAYTNLYGTFESSIESSDTVSQKLIVAAVAFILNVIFLHLLIPFMSESYQKVLKENIKIESLTKLEMIQNVCGLIRFCQKIKGKASLKRGYLVYCVPREQSTKNEVTGQGVEAAKLMKELFNKNEQNNKKRFADLGDNLGGNIESLQESIKGLQLAEYEYQRVKEQVEVMKQKNSCLEEFHAKVRELIDFEVIKGKNLVIKALDDVIMNCKNQEANVVRAGDFD